jgi:GH25 family lysozyme M1 (1,4-beta-N-acetylmuramidase)
MILGIDVSSYQKNIDYNLLFAKGIRFVIIKATQGNYLTDRTMQIHFQAAQRAGLITGFYHWHDPSNQDALQSDYYLNAVKGLNYSFTALDVEQYWSDWSAWPSSPKVGYTPRRISDSAQTIARMIRVQSNKPVIIYTRPTFIMDYAAPMLEWIHTFPTWYATYPYKAGLETLTWESLAARLPDPSRSGPFFPNRFPQDKRAWLFWQFTGDKFVLPGCNSPLDLNYFNGDLIALKKFAGVFTGDETLPPGLSVEERLKRLESAALAHGWVL